MHFSHLVIYITVPAREVGEQLASTLVENKLAACVNIVPGISSMYQWQGQVVQDDE